MHNPFKAVPLDDRLARLLCGYHSCVYCGDHPALWSARLHAWTCSEHWLLSHPPLTLARRRLLAAYPGLARRLRLTVPVTRSPCNRQARSVR